MCGIVGAIAERSVQRILVEGLTKLEYRGYDSAGLALLNADGRLQQVRAVGKVAALAAALELNPAEGFTGIAHTRWATHGEPAERNAHPHLSRDSIAVVHNGIIENHAQLRAELTALGYQFLSDTDTEVIAHLIEHHYQKTNDFLAAVNAAVVRLEGAYGLAAICAGDPDRIIATRCGSPLVIGCGIGETFIASDITALLSVTNQFKYLEEGDVADVTRESVTIYDASGGLVDRPTKVSDLTAESVDRGGYRHYMLKEIYEQPTAIRNTLNRRIKNGRIDLGDERLSSLLGNVKGVHIISCGTSFHSALVARYWIESLVGIPCVVEIASEYRYRQPVVLDDQLFVTISQSGETADTLAALRLAKDLGYLASLVICNVPDTSLVRESDFVVMTDAGREIGVASTKAFTTQLIALLQLTAAMMESRGLDASPVISQLRSVAVVVEQTLELDGEIKHLAQQFADKHHALFLGRGEQYPVAMEGALKLKEISYIHAEAYAAGELKHGPLALVDADMPVVTVAPNNQLLEKLKSNLEEVRARGGQLFVFADVKAGFKNEPGVTVIRVPHCEPLLEPIVYTIPLQLLSYHVAVLKGTDIDQPRNLAKSVTVE
ncbi:MAG: glucosamine--fructose-6-phosphate aminotransferase (isomerizing) [Gammaproteobacteria bacterium]|jgi:glucosamine--fructose-6-phosphate aminotransferase (isomerizing)